jgi:hypothetical protein
MKILSPDAKKSAAPVVRNEASGTSAAPRYVAKVTEVTPGDDLLTAKLLPPEQSAGLTVVWVEGMEKLSKDYVLQ